MEEDASLIMGLLVFILLILFEAILHGFSVAVENLNESKVTKKAEDGDTRAIWIKELMDHPYRTMPVFNSIFTFVSVIAGICQSRLFANLLLEVLASEKSGFWLVAGCYVVSTIAVVFFLVSFGILAPRKIAMRKAEFWSFQLAGIVRVILILCAPFGFLADKLSNLIVRLFGMDPNKNMDDVTEEEIISMVNEGHEQGVLMANEAEMIHNIFELDDKEAKDIMTHRKNMVAVNGEMTLSKALEYMLEKNNFRFPVYKESLDNIVGIVHIKDAMIQSRDLQTTEKIICEIPNLVRDATFIPETRNINSLFQLMQSRKSHIAIVVDEYGQTAGLVAMEDILEEIVGNILDEYDEEDNMITEQADGSFIMKGMAPLEEVCQILDLDSKELKDYDTLNGYLISLIDEIPKDHEVYEVQEKGYQFQVLAVENKIIQTVKVVPLKLEESRKQRHIMDSACQES